MCSMWKNVGKFKCLTMLGLSHVCYVSSKSNFVYSHRRVRDGRECDTIKNKVIWKRKSESKMCPLLVSDSNKGWQKVDSQSGLTKDDYRTNDFLWIYNMGFRVLDFYIFTAYVLQEKAWPCPKKWTELRKTIDRKSPGYTAIVPWIKTNGQPQFCQDNCTWSTPRTKTGLVFSQEESQKSVYTEAKNQESINQWNHDLAFELHLQF